MNETVRNRIVNHVIQAALWGAFGYLLAGALLHLTGAECRCADCPADSGPVLGAVVGTLVGALDFRARERHNRKHHKNTTQRETK